MPSADKWTFNPYEKIVESPDAWWLDEASHRALQKATWVVTEKVHGANFCVITDGVQVRFANRKHILAEGESFFAYEKLIPLLREQVLSAFSMVCQSALAIERLMLFGELFGGTYPHPDVPPDPSVQPIQTGIAYTPSIAFYAFDIALIVGGERRYLDYAESERIFQANDIFYATPLLTGKLAEALAYPLGFDSTIPARLGLPLLAEPNKAEGIVIKPQREIAIVTGKGIIRPVIKRKIAEFAEDRRFGLAEKWPDAQPATPSLPLEMLKWEVYNLVTANRLTNVISKVGASVAQSGKGRQYVFRLLCEDVMEQVASQHETEIVALTPSERQTLDRYLREEARTLMRG